MMPDQVNDHNTDSDQEDDGSSSSSSSSSSAVVRHRRHHRSSQENNNPPRAAAARDPASDSPAAWTVSSLWSTALFRALRFPFSLILDTLIRIARFTLDLIRADPGIGHDPVTEVASYIRDFESRYGPLHPSFHTGSYDQALQQARRELKFLIVYLHTFEDPEADHFVREVLLHEVVIQYINRNLITWSCSTSSYEGYKVSQGLREPSGRSIIAIIVQKEEGYMRLVRRIEIGSTSSASGSGISVERFLSIIDQTITQNESYIQSQRQDRAAREMNQEIRRQQDVDYEMSLAADREKEMRKAEEKRKADEEIRIKQEAVAASTRRKEAMMQLRRQLKSALPPEPDPNDPSVLRILIKLPDGSRLERRFSPNDSISLLYQFVYSQDSAPLNFQIVTNFPRKVLPCVSPSPENLDCRVDGSSDEDVLLTFEQIGLGKNQLLFVHDLEA